MDKSKLTLIVDGNWLLMSRLSVLNNRYADDLELNHDLKLLMIKSINVVLRTFPEIDNVIFVADGGSWRANVDIPSFMNHDERGAEVEYKGTRVKSDDFNWELLFSSYEDFMSTLSSTGITCCREKGMEGDDWCYHWSTYLNSTGTNVIIWSKDRDLTQLVKMSNDKCFTVWWNKDNGLFTSDTPEEEMNWLFNIEYSANENLFQSVCDHSKKVTIIDPKHVVIDKILRGDSSDNIFPIAVRKSRNNSGKQFRISVSDIPDNLDINNQNDIRNYLEQLISSKGYAGRVENTLPEIIEHFNYNKTLVSLDEQSYPQEIKDIMEQYKQYNISKNCSIAESQIQAEANKLNGILDLI